MENFPAFVILKEPFDYAKDKFRDRGISLKIKGFRDSSLGMTFFEEKAYWRQGKRA